MTSIRKRQLKSRYLRLMSERDHLVGTYDCGVALAGFINPRVAEIDAELDAIVTEVQRAMEASDVT